MTTYYAHTGMSKYNIPAQPYEVHIGNMFKQASVDCKILSPFLQKATLIAVLFHDFGKLDPNSQNVLSQADAVENVKMINHVDAGVAWCLNQYNLTNDISFVYAAYLVHAHHIGLQDKDTLFEMKIKRCQEIVEIKDLFRDQKFNATANKSVKEYYDDTLSNLYAIQYQLLAKEINQTIGMTWNNTAVTPIELRFALSVLADADHGDTSRHYGAPSFYSPKLVPDKRLSKLHKEVIKVQKKALKAGISKTVVDSRNVLFNECTQVDITQNQFFVCAAPTGKGKTFSLMNLSLRIASDKKKEKIFFIIPFTNIISQSVENYRKYTVLRKEDPMMVVNEIHSKVEFDDWALRKYSHLWNAPINVSTSVQFFESLFSNRPSATRKLMQFANSVIVFDEFHTALPHHLWKLALHTLKEMSVKFNIDFVFGSGTHVYYWDIFDDVELSVKEVVSSKVFDEFKNFENDRITFKNMGMLNSEIEFYNKFMALSTTNNKLNGNAVIVCNTVKNAVLMTMWFRKNTNWSVFHMSSYLAPCDREVILKKIHKALKKKEKILLVATSVIECGVDVSFDIGFRECASLMSTIQFGGRVNRNKEKKSATVYEFMFTDEFFANSEFTKNPSLKTSIEAREGIEVTPDNCTCVISNEIAMKKHKDLCASENMYKFNIVKDNFKVIEDLTVSVIVNQEIIDNVRNGKYVSPVEINRNSVSIYRSKLKETNPKNWCHFVDKLSVKDENILCWIGPYDPETYGVYAHLMPETFKDSFPAYL